MKEQYWIVTCKEHCWMYSWHFRSQGSCAEPTLSQFSGDTIFKSATEWGLKRPSRFLSLCLPHTDWVKGQSIWRGYWPGPSGQPKSFKLPAHTIVTTRQQCLCSETSQSRDLYIKDLLLQITKDAMTALRPSKIVNSFRSPSFLIRASLCHPEVSTIKILLKLGKHSSNLPGRKSLSFFHGGFNKKNLESSNFLPGQSHFYRNGEKLPYVLYLWNWAATSHSDKYMNSLSELFSSSLWAHHTASGLNKLAKNTRQNLRLIKLRNSEQHPLIKTEIFWGSYLPTIVTGYNLHYSKCLLPWCRIWP